MLGIRNLLAIAAIALVAGCQTTAPGDQGNGLNNQPGPGAVTSRRASTLFDKACFRNSPLFGGTYPFLKETNQFSLGTDGLYYHKSLNLSFFVHELRGFKVCSMVFFPDERFDTTLQEMIGYFVKKPGATGRVLRSEETVGGIIFNQDPTRSVVIDSTENSPVMRILVQQKL